MAANACRVADDRVPFWFSAGAFPRADCRVLEFAVAPGDASPPVLTPISPTPGSIITPSTPLVVMVEDNKGFSLREIWARYRNANQWELVHDGSAFVAPYTQSSIVAELGEPGTGYFDRRTYTVRRDGGWPAGAAFALLRFTVIDSAGNTLVLA